jgi:hypothetical protein
VECLVPFATAERKQLLASLLIQLHVPYEEFATAQQRYKGPRWENLTFEQAEDMIEAAAIALLDRAAGVVKTDSSDAVSAPCFPSLHLSH